MSQNRQSPCCSAVIIFLIPRPCLISTQMSSHFKFTSNIHLLILQSGTCNYWLYWAVMVLPGCDGSTGLWWFYRAVMVLPGCDGSTKLWSVWWFYRAVMALPGCDGIMTVKQVHCCIYWVVLISYFCSSPAKHQLTVRPQIKSQSIIWSLLVFYCWQLLHNARLSITNGYKPHSSFWIFTLIVINAWHIHSSFTCTL